MPWWAWVCLGLALLGIELGLVDAAFYIVFLGLSALIVGLMVGFGADIPTWGQLVIFAVLAIIAMIFFRQRFHSLVRGRGKGLDDALIGKIIQVKITIQPGQTSRIEYRGSTWSLRNEDDAAIESGSNAKVFAIDGLTLRAKNVD
jgi:membrane protein implicated in regulation of membrane protease activity